MDTAKNILISAAISTVVLAVVVRVLKKYKPEWATTLQGWIGF